MTVPGTFLEIIPITAPAVAGTYNLYLYAYNGSDCAGGDRARASSFTRAANTSSWSQHRFPTVTT